MAERGSGKDPTSRVGRLAVGGSEYREAMEQAFIDGTILREEAVAALGRERVEEIEYARQALTEDIMRGLEL